MTEKEIRRNRLADSDVILKMQFALKAAVNCLLRYWRRSIVILLKLHPQSGIYATKRISYFIFND